MRNGYFATPTDNLIWYASSDAARPPPPSPPSPPPHQPPRKSTRFGEQRDRDPAARAPREKAKYFRSRPMLMSRRELFVRALRPNVWKIMCGWPGYDMNLIFDQNARSFHYAASSSWAYREAAAAADPLLILPLVGCAHAVAVKPATTNDDGRRAHVDRGRRGRRCPIALRSRCVC